MGSSLSKSIVSTICAVVVVTNSTTIVDTRYGMGNNYIQAEPNVVVPANVIADSSMDQPLPPPPQQPARNDYYGNDNSYDINYKFDEPNLNTDYNAYQQSDYAMPEPKDIKIDHNYGLSSMDGNNCGCEKEISNLEKKLDKIIIAAKAKQSQQQQYSPLSTNLHTPPAAVMEYVNQYQGSPKSNGGSNYGVNHDILYGNYGGVGSGHHYGSYQPQPPQYGYGYQKQTQPKVAPVPIDDSADGPVASAMGNHAAYNSARTAAEKNKLGYEWYSAENNNDGYSEQIGYAGKSKSLDEQAAQEGYKKQEKYSNGGYKIDDTSRYEAGGKENQGITAKIRKQSSNQIDFQQQLADNYNNEAHSGNYKGNEFDIEMSVKDQQGGYKEIENNKNYNAKKSDGFKGESEFSKSGDYNGKDYINGKDWNNEGDYTTDGDYQYKPDQAAKNGDIDGLHQQSKNLYDQYKTDTGSDAIGKKKDDDFKNKFGYLNDKDRKNNHRNHPNRYDRSTETGEYAQDGDKREYGSAFDGKDTANKYYQNEGYANIDQNDKSKTAWDQGSYRDTKAKGHNKLANYQGDYATVKTDHDTKLTVRDDRQFIDNVDTDYQEQKFEEKYADGQANGKFANEKNGGTYFDYEQYKKYDTNAHKKAYEADSYANSKNSDGYLDNQIKKTVTDEQTVNHRTGLDNEDHYNRYGKGYQNGYQNSHY